MKKLYHDTQTFCEVTANDGKAVIQASEDFLRRGIKDSEKQKR
jgi:hypothetical protein